MAIYKEFALQLSSTIASFCVGEKSASSTGTAIRINAFGESLLIFRAIAELKTQIEIRRNTLVECCSPDRVRWVRFPHPFRLSLRNKGAIARTYNISKAIARREPVEI